MSLLQSFAKQKKKLKKLQIFFYKITHGRSLLFIPKLFFFWVGLGWVGLSGGVHIICMLLVTVSIVHTYVKTILRI